MRYMLDTNICSYILKSRPFSVKTHFEQVGTRDLCISTVVLAELYYGAARHQQGPSIRKEIMDMMIAAHARSQETTLVSNNTRHFDKVPGLLVANWV